VLLLELPCELGLSSSPEFAANRRIASRQAYHARMPQVKATQRGGE